MESHRRRSASAGFGIAPSGTWIARALHDALLADRTEELGTILVDPKNSSARSAYCAWGWEKLGDIQPFDDSPVFESLTKWL